MKKIKKMKPKPGKIFEKCDEFLLEKYGEDTEFLDFGIRLPKVIPEENKKLLSQSAVLSGNPWLRLRALLGSNYRADITFARLAKLVSNAYGAMKLLKCSKETSYRIWSSLEESQVDKLISLANPLSTKSAYER